MPINEKEFGEFKLETRTNTGNINHIGERMDSYHHDSKQRFDKIEALIADLPTESQIYRMFSEEAHKLAEGLIKKDEEQDVKITDLTQEITIIANNQKWYALGFGTLGTLIGGILGKHFP